MSILLGCGIVHRVVAKYCDRFGRWVVDPGPWLVSREDAENWSVILRQLGYQTAVESQGEGILVGGEDQDLAQALSSMA